MTEIELKEIESKDKVKIKQVEDDKGNIKTYAIEGGKEVEVDVLYFPRVTQAMANTRRDQWNKVAEELVETFNELNGESYHLAFEVMDLIQASLGLLNNRTTKTNLQKANKSHIKKLNRRGYTVVE